MLFFRRTSLFWILILSLSILPAALFAGGQKEAAQESAPAAQEAPAENDQSSESSQPEKKRSSLAVAAGAVATVNGKAISEDSYNEHLSNITQAYRAQSGGQISPEDQDKLKQLAIQQLINKRVILEEYQRLGLSVDPDRVDQEIEKLKSQYPSPEEFDRAMAERGYDDERLRSEVTQSLQVFKVQEHVMKDVEITEAELKSTYNNNLDKIAQPESVRARHILIKVPENASEAQKQDALVRIQAIREELEAGADFAALAKEKSEGPSAPRGGDLGYFPAEKMVPSFSEVAFAMEPGQISDVVETQFGYHLIKVEDHKDAWLPSFEEVKEQMRPQLEMQKAQYEFQSYINKIMSEADIKILRPDLKAEAAE